MTTPDLEPMADDLLALLSSERDVGPAPVEGKMRVQARLDAELFGPGGGGGDGGGETGGAGEAAAALTSGVTRAARIAAIFIAGGITGGAIVYGLQKPNVPLVDPVARAASEPTTVVVPTITRSAEPVAVTASASAGGATPPPPPTPGDPSAPGHDSLAAERAVLDPARTALGRRDGASALEAVKRHEARFPSGKLAEEREVIAVQALVVLHRSEEARARALRFRQRYAGSVMTPAIEAALENVE